MRNPRVDPIIGDKLKGQNQIRAVISVGERKKCSTKGVWRTSSGKRNHCVL